MKATRQHRLRCHAVAEWESENGPEESHALQRLTGRTCFLKAFGCKSQHRRPSCSEPVIRSKPQPDPSTLGGREGLDRKKATHVSDSQADLLPKGVRMQISTPQNEPQ